LPPERFLDFQRELLAEVSTIPGVAAAGTTSNVPLLGSSWGHGIQVGATRRGAQFTWVSPGYFDTMGIRLLEGRGFTVRDTQQSRRVAVVNQAFVRTFAAGVSVGVGLALLAGQSAGTLLFDVEPHDPRTLVAASLLLAIVEVAASFIPARRASKFDPLASLRSE
jgi:hypothetical protein